MDLCRARAEAPPAPPCRGTAPAGLSCRRKRDTAVWGTGWTHGPPQPLALQAAVSSSPASVSPSPCNTHSFPVPGELGWWEPSDPHAGSCLPPPPPTPGTPGLGLAACWCRQGLVLPVLSRSYPKGSLVSVSPTLGIPVAWGWQRAGVPHCSPGAPQPCTPSASGVGWSRDPQWCGSAPSPPATSLAPAQLHAPETSPARGAMAGWHRGHQEACAGGKGHLPAPPPHRCGSHGG